MSGGVVLAGKRVAIPGHVAVSWLDDAKRYPRAPHVYKRRKTPPQFIVGHATVGVLGPLWPDPAESEAPHRYAQYQASTTRKVSWDYTIGARGTIVAHNDPAECVTWQAGHANRLSLGVELEQLADGTTFAAQYPAFVALCKVLCEHFGIPANVSARDGAPCLAFVPKLSTAAGLVGVRGVIWHPNLTRSRGPGDPGPFAGEALLAAGFAPVDFGATP